MMDIGSQQPRKWWLVFTTRTVAICGVGICVAGLATKPGTTLGICEFLVVVAIALIDTRSGFFVAAALLPLSVTRGSYNSHTAYFLWGAIPGALLLIGVVYGLSTAVRRTPHIERDGRYLVVLVILIAVFAAFSPARITATFYLVTLSTCVSTYLLARTFVRDWSAFRTVCVLLTCSLGFGAGVAVLRATADSPAFLETYKRVYGDLAQVVAPTNERLLRTNFNSLETNFYAAVMVAAVFVAMFATAAAVRKRRRVIAMLCGAAAMLEITALWLTRSRGGLLVLIGSLLSATVAVGFRRLKGSRRTVWVVATAISALVAVLVVWEAVGTSQSLVARRLQELVGFDYSKLDRLTLITRAAALVPQHPFGVGLGNAWIQAVRPEPYQNVHNVWLQMWVEGGWLLGGLWTAVLIGIFVRWWRTIASQELSLLECVALLGLAIGLFGETFLEIAWLYDPVGAPLFWLLAGAASGVLAGKKVFVQGGTAA